MAQEQFFLPVEQFKFVKKYIIRNTYVKVGLCPNFYTKKAGVLGPGLCKKYLWF
ncbi:hypothetical protein [Synechococcus phage S-EIVl]|nr:hypothetical protein [Synechococcus phage S-EIVl]